jgi:S1-C subfamily serine protease
MRAVPRVGVQVIGVASASAAARAGIEIGDVITRFGSFEQPTVRQIGRAYSSAADRSLVAAVTRGDRHLVVAIEKWR